MLPQVCDLWPADVRTTFGAMSDCARGGDSDGLERGCRRVEAMLKRIEAGKQSRTVRLQIARSYYDLHFFCKDLGRLPSAKRALERARDRWQAALKSKPGDFYARTQLGACHNFLGLMAADAGDTDAARTHYCDALDARNEAYRRASKTLEEDDDWTDVCDNWTYAYGVMVNLANLYRTMGDVREARSLYKSAIRGLKDIIPRHRKASDREACEFFARQWETLHGQPHYSGIAARFLEVAKSGKAELRALQQGAKGGNPKISDAELKKSSQRTGGGNPMTPDERCREAAQLRQNSQLVGNSQKAEKIYRDAVRRNPDSWVAHYGLGEVIMFHAGHAGQWSGAAVEEGIRHLMEAATLAPKRVEPLLKLANKLSVCEPPVQDMAAAKGYYLRAIDALSEEQEFLYPEVWQGGDHWEFACESARIGDADIAVTAFAHAIRSNPTLYRTKFRPPDAAGVQCWLRAMGRKR
jgi:tetratricopeptide (TPR) repeat protein